MLGLGPDGALPLDVIGSVPVEHAVHMWETHRQPTAVSGDPHFRKPLARSQGVLQ